MLKKRFLWTEQQDLSPFFIINHFGAFPFLWTCSRLIVDNFGHFAQIYGYQTHLGRLPFVRTGRPERTGSHSRKWKGQGWSARLLTRSLRGIHARADVNNMADLATKLSNIPPTFHRDFLSPEEENTLFLNDFKEEFVFFFSYLYFFSS